MISGGAISQAALYSLLRLPKLRMGGRVFDDDVTGPSNLNRNMLTVAKDVGLAKVQVIARHCGPDLRVEPVAARFEGEFAESGVLSPRVLVGVDDIPSRWVVQRRAPGWLAVSGTSHFGISSSVHTLAESCSGCLHPIDDEAGMRPIPTVSYVSFWAGLAMAVRLVREAIGHPYPRNWQQLWLIPLRMEEPHAAIWSPVAARRAPEYPAISTNAIEDLRSARLSEKLAGVGWGFAGVFVLEIGVHIDALAEPRVEAFPPNGDLLCGVIFEAQAGVGKAGREHLWRRLLVGLGKAKRRLVLAKNGVRFVGVPGRVTYLKGERESFRAEGEKVFQQGTIELKRGRELHEDWSEVVAVV